MLTIREIQIKTIMSYNLTLVKIVFIKTGKKITNPGEVIQEGEY